MLRLVPNHWYSWDVTVSDESRPVAGIIVTNWMREKGELTIDAARYQMYREGWMSGDFILEQAGQVLARADKRIFRREFMIRHGGREYRLRPRSIVGRTYVLENGSREIGSVAPEGLFTRKAALDLPHDLPLPVRMFIVWLTVISWRRQQSS